MISSICGSGASPASLLACLSRCYQRGSRLATIWEWSERLWSYVRRYISCCWLKFKLYFRLIVEGEIMIEHSMTLRILWYFKNLFLLVIMSKYSHYLWNLVLQVIDTITVCLVSGVAVSSLLRFVSWSAEPWTHYSYYDFSYIISSDLLSLLAGVILCIVVWMLFMCTSIFLLFSFDIASTFSNILTLTLPNRPFCSPWTIFIFGVRQPDA